MNELSGCNLIAIASSLAIAISKNSTSDEMSILASFFSALGDNLAILAATTPSSDKQENCNC